MLYEADIVKIIADNKGINDRDVVDLIRVIAKYLKKIADEDNHELIEIPYIGYLYKRLDRYSEKEKRNSKTYEKKWLRSVYEYQKPNEINYYIADSILKKTYNVENKKQLQEALDNPSFKK